MRQLMISLDKKILDASSAVAGRILENALDREIFIVIPAATRMVSRLSGTVKVFSSGGGNKVIQFFRLLALGRKIIKQYNVSEITAQDPFFMGLAGWWLKKNSSRRLEVQLHGDFFSGGYYLNSGLVNLFRYWLGRFVITRADSIRAVGERVKRSLLKIGLEENIIIVRSVNINLDNIKNYQPVFDLHQKYSGCEKIFLFLGRLDQVKNISWLIDIFAEVVRKNRGYLLLIVGDGPTKEKLVGKVISLKLTDNIKFENWTADPISFIKTADCVLFPSLSEGYGLLAMEAATAGTPIIMNDVGVANFELPASDKVRVVNIKDRQSWIGLITDFVSV